MRILRFFGCFSDFLCPSTFIVLPSTLCKHILLVFVERFDNILRIDGRVVIIVLVLEQLAVLSIHNGDKGIVQFGGGPIVILGTDSCGKHLNLIFRNDVEDPEKAEEFYQLALDPANKTRQSSLHADGKQSGAALGAGISEGSRANIVRLILDNRNQGFLLPLLQDCLLSVAHCSVLDKFHPPILLRSDK